MDAEAEAAIRKAFQDAPPYNAQTIPERAKEHLNDLARGQERIYRTIEEMVKNGTLDAAPQRWKDWRLI